MTRLAQAFAKREGYGKPGAIPTVRNNPMDLRHSPHSSHQGEGPNDIGIIDTPEHGWMDAEGQLQKFANRGLTVRQAVYTDAPPEENDTESFLAFVCDFVGCEPDELVSDALKMGEA